MIRYLLDVNVLIALLWEDHESHARVQSWFRRTGAKSFATCALTQAGFVRIVSNPRFSPAAVTVREAKEMLTIVGRLEGHAFWPMNIGFPEASAPFAHKLFGHRQVSDAYLLGLAIKEKGSLATLDHGLVALAGDEFAKHVTLLA